MLDISAVICTKNAEKAIEECLKSVEKNNPSEIIVIDGESSDDTVKLAKRHTGKIFSDKKKGLGYARQLGAEKAKSEYVGYVDSDVVLTQDCLKVMITELEEKRYDGIHAQVLCSDISSYWEQAQETHLMMKLREAGKHKWVGSVTVVFRRDVILQNSFDPFFTGAAEDKDLIYRLRRKGLKLGISSVHVYHRHKSNTRDFIKQRIWYGRGAARFFWKFKSIRDLIAFTGVIPVGILVCIKKRSLKMLPYYVTCSVAGNVGFAVEMVQLILHRITLRKQPP